MASRITLGAAAVMLSCCFAPPIEAANVGGTLRSNTVWTAGLPIQVTNHVTVPTNITLRIEAGVQVQIGRNLSIIAQAGGAIEVIGAAANPVLFRPLNGTNDWRSLSADGRNARLTMRHADVAHGQTAVLNNASGLFEQCYFHDYATGNAGPAPGQPILLSNRAASLAVRACHFRNYYETLFQSGVPLIEDSLFEEITGDGIDFDAASPGAVIRRCTIRKGALTNVDAVDLGSDSHGVLVENCLIYDFPLDKGVSIGEGSTDITVRGCVIYGVDIGIAVKDSSIATLVNNTISNSGHGLSLYEKVAGQGGGHATAWNNILWDNAESVSVENDSTLALSYSVISGPDVYPGMGNLNANPVFRNAALRDYRLGPDSPATDAGTNRTTVGALFPVGSFLTDKDGDGLPDPWEMAYDLDFNSSDDAAADADGDGVSNLQEHLAGTNPRDNTSVFKAAARAASGGEIVLLFTAAANKAYRIEVRDAFATGDWRTLTEVRAAPSERVLQWPIDAGEPARFFRVALVDLP